MTIDQHMNELPGTARARAHDEMRPGRRNPAAEVAVVDSVPAEIVDPSWDRFTDPPATAVVEEAPAAHPVVAAEPLGCWHRSVLNGLSMSKGMGSLKPEFAALLIVLAVLLVGLVAVLFVFTGGSR